MASHVPPLLPLALAGALSAGCRGGAPPVPDEGTGPQRIILISLDTVRPDHLGTYGYDRPTSPAIDRFAASAVVFEDAVAQASATLSSHASILTSRIPRHHGASFSARHALGADVPTLAGQLRAAGYRTVAFTGGGQLDRRFGLGRGFQVYEETELNQNFRETAGLGIEWLRANRGERVFLFLHTYEPHHPYVARGLPGFESDYDGPLPPIISVELLKEINSGSRAIDERDLRHIVNAYDTDLRSTDDGFRRLHRFLRRQHFLEDALIVLTSDHGEEFGEHGSVGWHGHTLYEELLRVPLIVKLPGNAHAGTRVSSSVRSLDIAPTILDLAGVPIPETFQGVSLRSLWSPGSASEDRPALSELDATPPSVSYRRRPWKLDGVRLFNLEADPLETRDVAPAEARRVEELRQAVEEWWGLLPPPSTNAVELEDSTLEQLRALGYLSRQEQP
ncbi:MAG: sulfatase [Acidobacteria bacterium]|nr:sulfatase [Acidobacteriota bacterium]